MARLRIRMELDRGRVGVPLRKLSSVVAEADRFFRMLGEDVHIPGAGEWLALGFESNALNFTVEYVGRIEPHQIRDFNAAFGGNTQVRRATIAQFARIATALDEDEMVVFGLYPNSEAIEPGEWRSFSKRDALNIASELQSLTEASAGEPEADSRIPPALTPASRPLHDHDLAAVDDRVVRVLMQTVRAEVLERVTHLESSVSSQSEAIQGLREKSSQTEQSLKRMLTAVEKLCEEIPRQLAAAQPAAPAPPEPVVTFREEPSAPTLELPALQPESESRPVLRFLLSTAASVLAVVGVLAGLHLLGVWRFDGLFGPDVKVQAKTPVRAVATAPVLAPPAAPPPVVPSANVRVRVVARETAWLTVYCGSQRTLAKALAPGEEKTFEAPDQVRMLVGNAGGIDVSLNGKDVGP
ncbi:MAG: DUF4115 domain-containing protein, partial [Acidobacteria bacterium]|nr:DUF4115 domain-containing protein [Acidobacteriota bacterium]